MEAPHLPIPGRPQGPLPARALRFPRCAGPRCLTNSARVSHPGRGASRSARRRDGRATRIGEVGRHAVPDPIVARRKASCRRGSRAHFRGTANGCLDGKAHCAASTRHGSDAGSDTPAGRLHRRTRAAAQARSGVPVGRGPCSGSRAPRPDERARRSPADADSRVGLVWSAGDGESVVAMSGQLQ